MTTVYLGASINSFCRAIEDFYEGTPRNETHAEVLTYFTEVSRVLAGFIAGGGGLSSQATPVIFEQEYDMVNPTSYF